MKLEITTTKTEQLEIAIPSYTKQNGDYYAVLSEKTVIKLTVCRPLKSYIISHNTTVQNAYGANYEIITKETFFDEYKKTVDDIHEDMENAIFLAKAESEYIGENYESNEEEGQ